MEHSRTCKICGYELIQAHNYQNGKCVCGQEEPIEIKIKSMNQARLKKQDLDKIYSLAADVTGDEKVDFKDIVKINQFRLNKVTEL